MQVAYPTWDKAYFKVTLNGILENGNNKSGSRLNGLKNFTFEIYEISSNTIVMHAAK